MKYLNEFRDAEGCRKLVDQIHSTCSRKWTLMEVCGGQTHGLLRFGIDQQLAGAVEMIHGPGCPVCVTPLDAIDFAIELAARDGFEVITFGDMLRVPGSHESLLDVRARGGNVKLVYSPLDAVHRAQTMPERQIVFLAVGFETTIPATALAIQQAAQLGLKNFSMIVAHVRVLPAMQQIAESQQCQIDGFLAAGHVCSITGHHEYHAFVDKYGLPVVVTGFEPVDLLFGILKCVELLENDQPRVCNAYDRSVSEFGNQTAMQLVHQVYDMDDRPWRGFGLVSQGGFSLRSEFKMFDARQRFPQQMRSACEPVECRSYEVLTGQIKPDACECFGDRCTPDAPLGAPMVSSEGTCAAYFRYAQNRQEDVRR